MESEITRYNGTHPKIQIENRINELKRQIDFLKKEIENHQYYLSNREDELKHWTDYLDIIKTYEVSEEVRNSLIRAKVYTLEPPL